MLGMRPGPPTAREGGEEEKEGEAHGAELTPD